ncbi:MAG: protein translocase subunit SecD [Ignavibacteriales bacterium]|nr:protein translocase subunit SecD [Ignavibacteriales bacterium]
MRNQLSRLLLIACAVILAVYSLWPTYQDFRFRKTLTSLSGEDSLNYFEQHEGDILTAKESRVKLGLDLQGGMRVVLEVDILQLVDDLAKSKDESFRRFITDVRKEETQTDVSVIPVFAKRFQDNGIRLSRYYRNIRDDDATIISWLESEAEKSVDRAIEIVRNRVDQYRVSEPNIQKQGGRRIIVELPGVKDENEVRQLLQGTAKLEFRMMRDPDISFKVLESIDKYLTGKTTDTVATTEKKAEKPEEKPKDALTELLGGTQLPATADTTEETKLLREHPFLSYLRFDQRSGEAFVRDKDRDRITRLLGRADIQNTLPPDFEFVWSAKTQAFADGYKYYTLYPLKKAPELTGGVVVDARASVNPEDNRPVVNMEMDSEGAREWSRITGANIGKRVAIVLDNAAFSAPTIIGKIPGGRSQITGIESPNEARLLEIVLRAGALPAPVKIIEQRSVGPSLGEDSIRSGISASLIAFAFTILFMILYYNNAGFVADIALLFNMLFLLGVMAGFKATLTLPGIAGIVLTIGMAVDANVLINERIREEFATGKTLRAAVDAGYVKAFSAIFDSNITTFLTGLILYQFGTGPVQGFALTLMIGIVASMFSAIIITRVTFNLMIDRGLQPNFG